MKAILGAPLLLLASPIAAQQYNGPISAPCVVQPNLSCVPVPASNPLPVSGGGGGSGGGGDASAANQGTQITAANLTNTRLGDVSSPATGSVNGQLGTLTTTANGLFKAGQSIGNTGFNLLQGGNANASGNPFFAQIVNFPATQAVSATSLPLPAGAATASGLSTINTTLGSPFQAGGSVGNTYFGARLQDASGNAFGTSGNPIYVSGGGGGGSTPTGSAGSPNANVVTIQGISGGTVVPVTVGNFPATQAVSGSISVSNFPATQPVSGTVSANALGAVTTSAPSYTSGNQAAFSLTTAGALRVDGSATTQPISGTIANTSFAATQATAANLNATVVGTGTFAVQNTAATPAGTNTIGSIANITGTVPLPNGAATAANQNVTAAGTSASNAQGVQGVTGGVAMPISAAALPLPSGAATSALQTTGNSSLSSLAGTVGTTGSTAPTTNVQIGGVGPSGNARSVQTDTRGAFVGAQATPTSTRTTLTANTATAIEAAAVPARIGVSFFVEATLTAPIYICASQTTNCSATNYDHLIPNGAGAGTVFTPPYAANTRYYAYSTAAQVVVENSYSAQ